MTDNGNQERSLAGPSTDPQIARTLLANERTFLAWVRTALAFVAAGVALPQLLSTFGSPGARRLLAGALVALGALTAVLAYARWRANERAIRAGMGVETGRLPQLMMLVLGVTVVVGFLVAVLADP